MLHGYGASLLQGAAITLAVAIASLALAVLLGLAGALAKLSRSRFWRGAATVYTTLIRGVPDLVPMPLVFYGGQMLVNRVAPLLDLTGAAREVNSRYFLAFEAFVTAGAFYLGLTFILVALFHRAEARWLAHLQAR